MAAPTVYDNVTEDANVKGQLFAGKKFWVAQRCPMRNHFLDQIRNNGGEVVKLEKQADYMITDHCRRDCPPGSISYRFVEQSVKKGELEDPEQHLAGPPVGTARPAGSAARPAKGGRAAYTAEEDRILYKWVRDCEGRGLLSGGNEMYKQLESKYPRHTWQSWRDRYMKQLRDRPPSAFNIPDNAPPSPPSDEPAEPAPAVKKEAKVAPIKEASSSRQVSGSKNTRAKGDYTVEELNTLFNKEDWEELYAFVREIKSATGQKYLDAWKAWAEDQETRTADEWRQYFEKVVLPQWERDPVWKRENVRKEVEKKREETASQKASQRSPSPADAEATKTVEPEAGPSTPKGKRKLKRTESEDARFDQYLEERHKSKYSSAYVYFARDKKWSVWNEEPGLDYTELHMALMTQWESLPAEERAHYFALEAAEKSQNEGETTRKSPQVWLSSSTAVHETPMYITEAYQKALKRIHEGDYAEPLEEEQVETPRPAKRRKSKGAPSELHESIEEVPMSGTQRQPLEISSASSSTSESQLLQDDDVDVVEPAQRVTAHESLDSDLDLDALDTIPPPQNLELNSSDYPSNTPTPRAPRHRVPTLDTQVILSSPTQAFSLEALPRPAHSTQAIEEDDEPPAESALFFPHSFDAELPSEASTTHSLKEFRRSLTTADSLTPLPPPQRSSPPPSSPASTSSTEDPDPPLSPTEFDAFFDVQHAAGYTDDYITAALKHTRFRPVLAESVLAAWQEGKPLPNVRGVWSREDDLDVESESKEAMERLDRKHTMDGWGGITERARFLKAYRGRRGD
ncbi:hypothetical protein K458DRAFT_344746 [Lentithecium fluviatile CBS 122367]|uniref:DNA-binding protein RAP1 n=1 Tax=Lentithecium fluviatile CBS 122367 TaxID=1168545 RepID=A0A6G1IS13_9PLEO|nr:hypothetical protein K458DRAFT_344746 [Lentithecium fluviatile CBS 122367]